MPGADLAQDPAALVGGQLAGDLERGDGRLDRLLVLRLGRVVGRAGRRRPGRPGSRRPATSGDSTQRPARKIGCGLVPAAMVIAAGSSAAGRRDAMVPRGPARVAPFDAVDRGLAHATIRRCRTFASRLRRRAGTRASASRTSTRPRRTATTRPARPRPRPSSWPAWRDLQDRFWAEAQALGPRRPPGDRRRRQGRHDQQGHGGVQPAGLPGHVVQGAQHRGARPRLPVADPQGASRARARSASSTARTTRTSSSSASTTSCPKAVWSKRYDQINAFEQHLADNGTTIVKFFLSIIEGRAARAVPGPLRRPDEALEVLARRPRGAQALGRLPGGVRRRPLEDVDGHRRRGTSSRPTASGSATSRSSSILADTLADLEPAYPAAADLPPDLVIE